MSCYVMLYCNVTICLVICELLIYDKIFRINMYILNISFYSFMLLCDQFYCLMLLYVVLWYIVFYFIDINCLMKFSIFAYSHQFSVLETLLHCQIIHISYLVLRCNNLCRNILAIVQFWFFKIHTNLAY